jgi:hypothetical protein
MSSTIAHQSISKDARMDACFAYILGHKKALFYLLLLATVGFDFQSEEGTYLHNFLLLAATSYAQKAVYILQLDSKTMDLHDEDLENTSYNNLLWDITLASYINDNECENNTRFSKLKIMTLMHCLEFGDGTGYIHVYTQW